MNTTTTRGNENMNTATAPSLESLDGKVKRILSDNAKLRKLPSGEKILNAGVMLAPSKRSGVVNVCPHATPACILVCVLWFAGRTVTAVVRKAATARTALWHYFPEVFYSRLRKELLAMVRKAAKLGCRAFCRLNTASDIEHPVELIQEFPETTFYDYSKGVDRCMAYGRGELPANYHLSYSVSERSEFATVRELLGMGVNVVVVVDSHYFGPLHRYGVIPSTLEFTSSDGSESIAVDTVDGDIQDIRTPEFDGKGKAVILRAKGSADLRKKAQAMGFIFRFTGGQKWYVDEHHSEGICTVRLK